MIALPLSNLPSVVSSVLKFYTQPTDPAFELMLSQQLSTTFPNLPRENIETGVKDYLRILREELITTSPEYRQTQGTLASIRVENNTQSIVSKLHNIASMVAEYLERDKDREIKNKISWRLSKLKNELKEHKNAQELLNAILLAEVYHDKGYLDASIEKLLENAYRVYFDLKINPVKLIEIEDEIQIASEKLAQKSNSNDVIDIKNYLEGRAIWQKIESFKLRERVLDCVNELLPNHLTFAANVLASALELPLNDDSRNEGKNSDVRIIKDKLEEVRELIRVYERELKLY